MEDWHALSAEPALPWTQYGMWFYQTVVYVQNISLPKVPELFVTYTS